MPAAKGISGACGWRDLATLISLLASVSAFVLVLLLRPQCACGAVEADAALLGPVNTITTTYLTSTTLNQTAAVIREEVVVLVEAVKDQVFAAVPTKTSDLANDNGFITVEAVQGVTGPQFFVEKYCTNLPLSKKKTIKRSSVSKTDLEIKCPNRT